MSTEPSQPRTAGPGSDDWWAEFHLHAFLSLVEADTRVERRELVWIRRFFDHQRRPELYERFVELACGDGDGDGDAELQRHVATAAERLSTPDKRRFVYNMAQMCKSKGTLSSSEYERILDLSEQLGIKDTEADAIVNSVFSINESFTAIMGLLALGFILYSTRAVIVPLVIALFITMIINKVESLVARGLKQQRLRWLNKLVAMVLILGTLFALVNAAVRSGRQMSERYTYYEGKVTATLQQLQDLAAEHDIPGFSDGNLSSQLKELPIGSTIQNFLGSMVGLLSTFFLVVVFTGFLVFSGGEFTGIMQEMNDKISGYISVKTVINLITGVAAFVLCVAFGIDFPLFWGLLAFLLNYIPNLGSIVATVPPILLAMVQLDSWGVIIAFALLFAAMQVIIGQILEPKLMGSRLAVKPVAILLGLIFWGFLWGLPGMFLAAPLMALLRILASYFNFSRNFERLLAAD